MLFIEDSHLNNIIELTAHINEGTQKKAFCYRLLFSALMSRGYRWEWFV